ncbi:MAG TPA: glycine zipper domain-containing protein [Candidatus Binatia bacterium]|jgi:phage tail tape-measure protein
MNPNFIFPAGLLLILLLGGCSESLTSREIRAAVGTLAGAVAGAILGRILGHAASGAAIGGAAGLATGTIIRDRLDSSRGRSGCAKKAMPH